MKIYKSPEITVIQFGTADVLTGSINGLPDAGTGLPIEWGW